jgi:hypothetical protein
MNTDRDIFGNDQWAAIGALAEQQRENAMRQGMVNAGMANQYANQLAATPRPTNYRGVFTDADLEALQDRTRQRQRKAFDAIKAMGRSVLTR